MSGLEEAFELEMEQLGGGDDTELELMAELEEGFELEGTAESGEEFELEGAVESGEEFELEGAVSGNGYAERLYEISTRQYESEAEVEAELRGVLDDMEREYFFGKLIRRGLSGGLGRLAASARRLAPGLPIGQALRGLSMLSSGNLKGALASLAKAGLGTALRSHPGGMAALAALQGLGFKETEVPQDNREAWNTFANISREAFERLADSVDETSATPAGASRQAAAALQTALARPRLPGGRRPYRKRRIVRLRPGDRLIVAAE